MSARRSAFPDHFAWGTTSSSVQLEGVAPAADWSAWERDGRAPRSNEGSGFRIDWRDDLRLQAEMGCNAVRLTIEWARIEPEPHRVDSTQLDWYADVISHARDLGLAPWLTLHSTSLPGWFSEDERGFRDAESLEYYWVRHVDRCAERFASLAAGWVPIDDPIGWAMRGHYLTNRPPAVRDGQMLREAIEGALEADHRAAQLLAAGGEKTMAVRGVPTIFGHGPGADIWVKWWASMLFDTWIDVLDTGELQVPDRRVRVRESWVDDFDYIGLSFDNPIGVDDEGALHPAPQSGRRADNGFVPLPEELGVLLYRIAERLPERSLVVASNGVSTSDDTWREQLLSETIDILATAVSDGIDLVGYFHDTAVDGYEWRAGHKTQRGLIGRDRNLKDSGQWLSNWLHSR